MQKEVLKNYCSPDEIYVWYDDIFTNTVLQDSNNLTPSGNYFKNQDTDIIKNEDTVILIVSILLSKIIALIIWKKMFTCCSKEINQSLEETVRNCEKKLNDKNKECQLIKKELMDKNGECEQIQNRLNSKNAELNENLKECDRIRSDFSSECEIMKKCLNEKTKECERIRNESTLKFEQIQSSLNERTIECDRIRNQFSSVCERMKTSLNENALECERIQNSLNAKTKECELIQSSLDEKSKECDRIRNQFSSEYERIESSFNENSKECERIRNENDLRDLSYLNSYEVASTLTFASMATSSPTNSRNEEKLTTNTNENPYISYNYMSNKNCSYLDSDEVTSTTNTNENHNISYITNKSFIEAATNSTLTTRIPSEKGLNENISFVDILQEEEEYDIEIVNHSNLQSFILWLQNLPQSE